MTSVPDKSVFSWQNIGISILGGIAAAAIFAVVARGGFGGLLFAHLAPLPLMIVALGFGVRHGFSAAIVATVILSIWLHPVIGMAYALLVAGPGWFAAYVASGAPRGRRDLVTAHVSSWASLAPATVLATAILLWIIVATISFGSIDEALNPIRARAFILLDAMVREKELSDKINPTELSGSVARAVPAFLAAYGLLIHIANLWIAARLAQASSLLTRPWPDIATDFHLPRAVGGVFLSGLVMTLFSGPSGAMGLVLAMTMGLLLALQGLAVVHIMVRGSRSSALVLSIIYFMLGLLGWPIVPLAALGAADLFFNYRDRKTAAAPAQPQKPAEKSD
ncbi:YybS family protein [Methylocystis sp. WRRC1]|uniref:DUF2232 domain-containing protein n=1 Tax=Methylocystis sp. WRRC1 TaxID=1732014 RepID=UPI001D15E344|nr:DUF2232 domain-containing protein [Methylocystis sp. WRRC1]MCC3243878.1 YybS family protein [Methylocystis sp. WRRC1]